MLLMEQSEILDLPLRVDKRRGHTENVTSNMKVFLSLFLTKSLANLGWKEPLEVIQSKQNRSS